MGRPKKNTVEQVEQPKEQEVVAQTLSVEEPQDSGTQKDQVETVPDNKTENGETPKEPVSEQQEETKPTDEPAKEAQPEPQESIPANVGRLLKIFSNQPTLYIGEKGGVYSTEHKEFNTKKYTNPYYKK